MPPKTRITRDMVVDAALQVIREAGAEGLNARSVAAGLGCSTQPVMYHFQTVSELRRAAFAKLDHLHTAYLTDVPPDRDPLLGIGLNYVRFAISEPNWFRFLFQSGLASEKSLPEMIESSELTEILSAMQAELGMSAERTKEVFLIIALFVHGYASIIANNSLEYDEAQVAVHLERAFQGAVLAAEAENKDLDGLKKEVNAL